MHGVSGQFGNLNNENLAYHILSFNYDKEYYLTPTTEGSKIGEKSGAYDKARNSKIRRWADGLTGWKYWAWQLGCGILAVIVIELVLNQFSMTMLPWR